MSALALFAAIDPGVITILLVIFFAIISAVGQMITKMREEAKQQARARAQPRPPDQNIQQEIDEFLRRASQRRGERGETGRDEGQRVQPQRTSRVYIHDRCGKGTEISGTDYARMCDPSSWVAGTYCVHCHRMVSLSSIKWEDTGEVVAQYRNRLKSGGGERPPEPSLARARTEREVDEYLSRVSQGESRESAQPELVTAELVEDEAPVGDRMGRQVQQDLDTSEFGRRSAQLGEEVAQADEQFDERAEHTFAHDVGRLSMRPGETASPTEASESAEAPQTVVAAMTQTTTGVATILGDPNSILQAIIMSEILQRPEERWGTELE